MPEFLTGAGVIDGLLFFEGEFKGLLVHVGQHQGLTSLGVDCHGGD